MYFYAKHTKPRKTYTNTKPATISKSKNTQDSNASRPSSGASVWSTMDTLMSPLYTSDEDIARPSPSQEKRDTTPKSDKGAVPGKKRRLQSLNCDVEEILDTDKQICSSLAKEKSVNNKFGEYVALRLNKIDPEEAKQKRKDMLTILEA